MIGIPSGWEEMAAFWFKRAPISAVSFLLDNIDNEEEIGTIYSQENWQGEYRGENEDVYDWRVEE